MNRHDIIAAIKKRGKSITQLSEEAGLSRGACTKALTWPFPAAEAAIAACLNKPLHVVFPQRYRRGSDGASVRVIERGSPNTRPTNPASRNRPAA